ncbi:uncharacterized protein LOC127240269 isoform X2 [Andrographis paniculata]|uniref:uncharacterized protein LOC127240269 isoform X2 n=1 Tax=Andrographis paniculata TaxID=175694 RepID=UPI0021E82AF2|nr:uncharacterized protein LOC127240269 isoform X2 [Andrographis paniculata]
MILIQQKENSFSGIQRVYYPSKKSHESGLEKKTIRPEMLLNYPHHCSLWPAAKLLPPRNHLRPEKLKLKSAATPTLLRRNQSCRRRRWWRRTSSTAAISASLGQLDLTEDNIKQVLADARTELAQLFDTSVNITELAELDGPYVKISLSGRFWHKRSTVLARLGNYLKQRIPEILEVDIEDEKQLDDSPENF